MPSRIPSYVRTWIISLHKSGMSTTEILGTLHSEGEAATIQGIAGVISRFEKTRSVADRPRSGRPLAHDINIGEIIDRHLKTNDELTARHLQAIILKETGERIPHSTIKTARKKEGWVCAGSNFRKFVKKPTGRKRLIFSLKNMKELTVRESDEALPINMQPSTSNVQAVNSSSSPLARNSSQDDTNMTRTTSETPETQETLDDDDDSSCPSPPPSPPSSPEKEQPVNTQTNSKIQEEHNRRFLALEQKVVRLEALINEEAARHTRLEQKVQMLSDTIMTNNQHGDTTAFESTQEIGQCTSQSEGVSNTIQNTSPLPLPSPQSAQQVQKSEINHTQPMECIFKIYLGQRTIFQGKWCYEPTQILLNEVVMHGHNPPGLAREVLRKIFTPYELLVSNVRGYKKVGLDELRVQTIRMLVVKMCNVPIGILDHCWTVCVRAMDQALRNDRKCSKKKHP